MKKQLYKQIQIKSLVGLFALFLSLPAISQNNAAVNPTCAVELAGQYFSTSNPDISISRNAILQAPTLSIAAHADYTVIAFTMVVSINGTFVESESTGNNLTPGMIDLLNKAKSGSTVVIKNVSYKTAGVEKAIAEGIQFTIN